MFMVCYSCGSDKLIPKKFNNRDRDANVLCICCYHSLFYAENGRQSARRSNLKRVGKRMRFMNKEIKLKSPIRIDVCNYCRAVAPFDTSRTHMHHEEYDESDPLKHTIESCLRCHNKISRELGQIITIQDTITGRFT